MSRCCGNENVVHYRAMRSEGVVGYSQVRHQGVQFRTLAHRVSDRLFHDDLTGLRKPRTFSSEADRGAADFGSSIRAAGEADESVQSTGRETEPTALSKGRSARLASARVGVGFD